ncbi:MAG: glycosyl hydrolase [Acidobacteriota bacterium]
MKTKLSILLIFLLILMIKGDESQFGINAHVSQNRVLNRIKTCGIQWVRIDLEWAKIENTEGEFYYFEADRVIDRSNSNGLSILGILYGSPGWSNKKKGPNYPPLNPGDWRRFVRKTVNKYKNSIKYWNIWNEPNVEKFFAEGKDVFVEQIFIPAAEEIRRVDPEAIIVGPELAHLNSQGSEWYFWMKYILTEAGEYIDIVSHHIYKNDGVYAIFEALESGENIIPPVKDIVRECGFSSKPFWITETGWDTELFSEEEQANRYLDFLKTMRSRNYPHKVFFYQIIDDTTPGIRPWGILRTDLSEKPAYKVYADFIKGIYPQSDDDEEIRENRKCYMENSLEAMNMNERGKLLSVSRQIRDRIKLYHPAYTWMIEKYYRLSSELFKLTLSDPRLFRLSSDLFIDFNKLLSRKNHSQDKNIFSIKENIKRIIIITETKRVSEELQNVIKIYQNKPEIFTDLIFKLLPGFKAESKPESINLSPLKKGKLTTSLSLQGK